MSAPKDNASLNERIVITGIGIVSPLGNSTEQFWQSLTRSHITTSGSTNSAAASCRGVATFEGRIDEFGELPAATSKALRKSLKLMNRETQIGVAAGQQALTASRLLDQFDPEQVGVCFGADNVSVRPEDFADAVRICHDDDGELDLRRWGKDGISEMAPLWLLKCLPNMPACHLAILNDLRGPNNTITQRDVAFGLAIAEACRCLRSRDAKAMLVGATGTTLSPFSQLHARLEDEVPGDQELLTSAVADKRSNDVATGEGAGALVLETLPVAQRRGAHIYGEILNAASASFVGHDGAAACGRALATAMRTSLRRSQLSLSSVGHIHAHGLGSTAMDGAEREAIAEVFGSAAPQPPVVATKSRMGHAGAGSAAIELIGSLLAMQHGELFPCDRQRDELSKDPHRSVDAVAKPAGDSFLSLSMFGRGLGSCIAVGAFRE